MKKSIYIFYLIVFFIGIAAAHNQAQENALYTLKIKVKVGNVRSGPSLDSFIITQLREGAILQGLKKEGEWYLIILPAQEGIPERRAYVHQSIINIISQKTESKSTKKATKFPLQAKPEDSRLGKNQKPTQDQNITPRDRANKSNSFKRIYLSAEFNAGFQEESLSSIYSKTIYHEAATSSLGYVVKKGTPFMAALGFRISRSIGVELGVDVSARNLESIYSSSIPHPLLFNSPRTANGTGSNSLSENTIFLNFVFGTRFGKFGIDLSAGPAYILSKAQIISEISYSHSYPYNDISLSTSTTEVSMNVFGFNGGAKVLFHLNNNFALFSGIRYIGGKASFDPETGLSALEITLGGFKAGGGLQIFF